MADDAVAGEGDLAQSRQEHDQGFRGLDVVRREFLFFFSSRRRHTRCSRDWSSDVCSSDLGFAPLPPTFWERSLFTKPTDRDVVCHASAWDVDSKEDLRIKMCIQIREEDFRTIHHELGHNFYQRAYVNKPPLFQGRANDGFYEAVADL